MTTPPQPVFTNDAKPVDPFRRMHRIGSPSTDVDNVNVDGQGFDCGCRTVSDYEQSVLGDTFAELGKLAIGAIPVVGQIILLLNSGANVVFSKDILNDLLKALENTIEGRIFARFLGSVPSWVPVDRKKADFKEVEKEIEGRVKRSYFSTLDNPFFQWDHWYSWTFLVEPDPKLYANMRGPGNRFTKDEIDALTTAAEGNTGWQFVDVPDVVPCVLDAGASYLPPRDFDDTADGSSGDDGRLQHPPGIMFDPKWPLWPQAGDWFWAAGRWVYNCGHRTSETPEIDPKSDDPDRRIPAQMPTQVHPCKAIAWSRNDTFLFEPSEGVVPATLFMFFANRRGGYKNFDTLKEADPKKDYEFIVDLPPIPDFPRDLNIGASPDFPLNTIVLPPRLRVQVDLAPFGANNTESDVKGEDKKIQFGQMEPFVEPILFDDPNRPPEQVRIIVPMSELTDADDAYGFRVALGWTDVDSSQRERIKKVTVRFDKITIGPRDYSGKWRLHFGVNGRWSHWGRNDIDDGKSFPLTTGPAPLKPFTMFVAEDGFLEISVHGHSRRGIGAIFEETKKDRTLTTSGLIPIDIPPDAKNLKKFYDQLPDEVKKKLPFEQFEKLPLDAIFGAPKAVTWDDDIDTKITGGANNADKKTRASAVVRELSRSVFLKFNRENEPLGVLDKDVLDFNHINDEVPDNDPGKSFEFNPLPLSRLLPRMKAAGKNVAAFKVSARRCEYRSGTDTLYQRLNPRDDALDYTLFFTVTVEDQPFPTPPAST